MTIEYLNYNIFLFYYKDTHSMVLYGNIYITFMAKTEFKRLSINIFTKQNIYESNSSVTYNFNSKTINTNSHIVMLVILTPRNCKSCVSIQEKVYKYRLPSIMIINNKLINSNMLIASVLWISKSGKQVYPNNQKRKRTTQHLELPMLTIEVYTKIRYVHQR